MSLQCLAGFAIISAVITLMIGSSAQNVPIVTVPQEAPATAAITTKYQGINF